jgi:GNAT superfamily N-acetyltransferase
MKVRLAKPADLPHVIAVQRDAFGRVADELAIDPAMLPPLHETEEHLASLLERGTTLFVAEADGRVVGSVRGDRRERTVHVGRLVVAAGRLRRGVATALMDALEAHYSDAECFELFTGADAARALRLYRARGYVECRTQDSNGVPLVWLEKHVSAGNRDSTERHPR